MIHEKPYAISYGNGGPIMSDGYIDSVEIPVNKRPPMFGNYHMLSADELAHIEKEIATLRAALCRASHEVAHYLSQLGFPPTMTVEQRVDAWLEFCEEMPDHPSCSVGEYKFYTAV
jgi:hypothetical protein